MIRSLTARWKFFDFVYASGNRNNPIETWREGLSEDAELLFNNILKDCAKVELPIHWVAFKRYLSGKCKEYKIWELYFVADKRQYRILGNFGPGKKEATLLIGCYHKQDAYTPRDTLDTAYRRASLLARGEADRHERKIPTDR